MKKETVFYRNKKITVVGKKVSFFGKFSGLMFKKNTTENLLFGFDNKTKMRIHSYFVFFDFLAVWLDENNAVIEFRVVRPFTLSVKPEKSFSKLIEIPLNGKNQEILEFFVGKKSGTPKRRRSEERFKYLLAL